MELPRGRRNTPHGPKRNPGPRDEAVDWDDVPGDSAVRARLRRRSASSATFEELLAGGADDGPFLSPAAVPAADTGIVLNVASGRCRVFHDGMEKDCLLPPQLASRQKSMLAVGDSVAVEAADGANLRIPAVPPRPSRPARPDPLHSHLPPRIAANIHV